MAIDANTQTLCATKTYHRALTISEILIKVSYIGVNRADILQLCGQYPLPESMIPGLEVSGTVVSIGSNQPSPFKEGDKVCALLSEGGYGEYVIADVGLCLHIPDNLSLQHAAALPEALATSWYGLYHLGKLQSSDTVIIHGGNSGIGIIAIQMAHHSGANVITTVRDTQKSRDIQHLGAHVMINDADEAALLAQAKQHCGSGATLIFDMIGGSMMNTNCKLAAYKGRIISIGCMESSKVQLEMGRFLMKNLKWQAMTLRSQSIETKRQIITSLKAMFTEAIKDEAIIPMIHSIYPLNQAIDAHNAMKAGKHCGKILLKA